MSRNGRPATQCAAVATRSGAISAPPQNGSSACHGYADGFALVPPTTAAAGAASSAEPRTSSASGSERTLAAQRGPAVNVTRKHALAPPQLRAPASDRAYERRPPLPDAYVRPS